MKVMTMAAMNLDNKEGEDDEKCDEKDDSGSDKYFSSSDDGGIESSESDEEENDGGESKEIEYEQNEEELEQSMLNFQGVLMTMNLILQAEVLIVIKSAMHHAGINDCNKPTG